MNDKRQADKQEPEEIPAPVCRPGGKFQGLLNGFRQVLLQVRVEVVP
ncbi:hypothetical protein [Paenibacillus yonginensis]|nr:hypothetical protein [Paenibacillus yonginensis]